MKLSSPGRRAGLAALLGAGCMLVMNGASAADPIKIGFLVKQAEEPWFQDEWRGAEKAAKELGFTLVKIGVPNGEKMIAAIDNLAAQKAQGFVICAPDVKLGKAVERAAKRNNMKVISVDDRLLDGAGVPIAAIPHLGMSGPDIGKQVGEALVAEIKARKWKPAEVGALRIAYDQLPTARDRTMGALQVLNAAGVPAANTVDAPQAKTDTESAFNAANIAFTKRQAVKHWVTFGLNDEAVMGAIRAAGGRSGVDIIGVGIGGSKTAQNEFAKPAATPFYGSIMVSATRHGYETSSNLYQWIAKGKVPPPLTLTAGTLMTRQNYKQMVE